MADHDPHPHIIRAAIAMAGHIQDLEASGLKAQYIELAERAAKVLGTGKLLEWDQVEQTVAYVLAQNRNLQTNRKPDETAVLLLARKIVAQFKLCGYTVHAGPGVPGHSTPNPHRAPQQ